MKTLGRIVIILVAALVVAGATVAFSQSSLASSMFARGGREGFEGRRAVEGQLPAGQFPGNFERRGRDEAFGGINLFSLGPIIKDVAIMGGITIVVIIAAVALRAGKRSKQTQQSLAAGQVVNQHGLS
jgi:heme A synthase